MRNENRRQVNGRRRTESKVEKLSACLPEKALYTMNIYNLMLIEVIQTAIMIMGLFALLEREYGMRGEVQR